MVKPISDGSFMSGIVNDANCIETDEEKTGDYEEFTLLPPELFLGIQRPEN